MSDFKTRKEYLNYRGEIYNEKDDREFKSRIRQLYQNKSIRTNWLKKELKILRKSDNNFITYIGLIVSSLIATFTTSTINNPDEFKQIKDAGILAVLEAAGTKLLFWMIIGLIILIGTIIILLPATAISIPSKLSKRHNYEIDQIIGALKKTEIKKIFDNESKRSLIIKLIRDLVTGTITGIASSVIILLSI